MNSEDNDATKLNVQLAWYEPINISEYTKMNEGMVANII